MSSKFYAVLCLLSAICAIFALRNNEFEMVWLLVIMSNTYDIQRKLSDGGLE